MRLLLLLTLFFNLVNEEIHTTLLTVSLSSIDFENNNAVPCY